MDVHTPVVRSANMRAIKNRNTKPELLIRKALHARGFRYRINVKKLSGTPDIVFTKQRALIFVHGCFWHGHRCHLFKTPQTRTDFWLAKIESNRKRDIITSENLNASGWRIAVVWECALKGRYRLSLDLLVNQLCAWITDPRIHTIEFKGTDIEGISDA